MIAITGATGQLGQHVIEPAENRSGQPDCGHRA
jgi:uncharacterized protein YbjT (DUF2867 family)